MAFAYYRRLTPVQQRIYRRSDQVTSLRLPDPAPIRALVPRLAAALGAAEPAGVQAAARELFAALTRAFAVRPCRVEVLSARPHGSWGELQGLYTTGTRLRPPTVQLWMRTAQRRRVVAFRTFLRTLVHELGHHLDYSYLRLPDSFHTEGFYKRESSLMHQLLGGESGPGPDRAVLRAEAVRPPQRPPSPSA